MEKQFDSILSTLRTGRWNVFYFVSLSYACICLPCYYFAGAYVAPALQFSCVAAHQGPDHPEDHSLEYANDCFYYANESGRLVQEKCAKWHYNTSVFKRTLTSEFDLVCDSSTTRTNFHTVYFIGNMIGSLLNGVLSDRFGRKRILTLGAVLFFMCGTISAWLPSVEAIYFCRFLISLCHSTLLQTAYILGMEVCEVRLRSTIGIVLVLPWAFGMMAWGGLAYFVRDWRWLQFYITLLMVPLFPLLWLMDESPRWLIVNGHHKAAMTVLKRAASWNGTNLPQEEEMVSIMNSIKEDSHINKATSEESLSCEQKLKSLLVSTLSLIRTKTMLKRTLLLYFNFSVQNMVYYGLALSAVTLSSDPFLYMILGGLMEVPAYSLTPPLLTFLGRRAPVVAGYILCGLSIIAVAFVPKEISWLVISLALLGRFCISAVYQMFYLYSTELWPTEVRLQGIGSATLISRLIAITSPFIIDDLGPRYPQAPALVFGGLSLLGGVSSLAFPETLGLPLPDTIADVEKIP